MRPDDHWYIGGLGIPKPHRLPVEEWISIAIGTIVMGFILYGYIYLGSIWFIVGYLAFGYFFIIFGIGMWRPWWEGTKHPQQSKKESAALFVFGMLVFVPVLAIMWPMLIGIALFDRPQLYSRTPKQSDYSENGNHA